MKNRHLRLAGTGLALSLQFVMPPANASDEILLSADGENWGPAFDQPIFADAAVLVPGAQASRSFWIRNGGAEAADLALAVMGTEINPANTSASLWVRASVNDAEPVVGGSDYRSILTLASMDPAASRKITVTVGLGDAAPNDMQQKVAPVHFEVRLSQSVPPADSSGGDPAVLRQNLPVPHVKTPLAETGFTGVWIVTLGASFLSGGLLAVFKSRTKRNPSKGTVHGTS